MRKVAVAISILIGIIIANGKSYEGLRSISSCQGWKFSWIWSALVSATWCFYWPTLLSSFGCGIKHTGQGASLLLLSPPVLASCCHITIEPPVTLCPLKHCCVPPHASVVSLEKILIKKTRFCSVPSISCRILWSIIHYFCPESRRKGLVIVEVQM